MAAIREVIRLLSDLTSPNLQTRTSAEAALSGADQSELAIALAHTAAADSNALPNTSIRTLATILLRQVVANSTLSTHALATCQNCLSTALLVTDLNSNAENVALRNGTAAALVEILETPQDLSAMLRTHSHTAKHSACSLLTASLDRAVKSTDQTAIKSVVDIHLPDAIQMLQAVFGATPHNPLALLTLEMLPLATSVLSITARLLKASARDVSRSAGVVADDLTTDTQLTSRQTAMSACAPILAGLLRDPQTQIVWTDTTATAHISRELRLLQWSALHAALALTDATGGNGGTVISSSFLWPLLDSLLEALEAKGDCEGENEQDLCDSMGDHVSINTTTATATRLLAAVVLKEAANAIERPFGVAPSQNVVTEAGQYLSRMVALACLPVHILAHNPRGKPTSAFDANEFLIQDEGESAAEFSPRVASLELLLALVDTFEPDSQLTERALLHVLRSAIASNNNEQASPNTHRQLEAALFLAGSAALRVGVQVLGGDDQYESGEAIQVVRNATLLAMSSPYALVQARGLWCLGLIAAELHQVEHVLGAIEVVVSALTSSASQQASQQQQQQLTQPRVLVRNALAGESLGRLALALSEHEEQADSTNSNIPTLLVQGIVAIVNIAQSLSDDLVYLVFEPLHVILQAYPAVGSRVEGCVASIIVSQWARTFHEPQARDGLTDVVHALAAATGAPNGSLNGSVNGVTGWAHIVMAGLESALLAGNDSAWALYRVTLAARVGNIPIQEISQVQTVCLNMIGNDGKTAACDAAGVVHCNTSVLECTAALARAGVSMNQDSLWQMKSGDMMLGERVGRAAEYLINLAVRVVEYASASELLALCVAGVDLFMIKGNGGLDDVSSKAQVALRAVQALVNRRDADAAFDVCLALCALLLLEDLELQQQQQQQQQQHQMNQPGLSVPRWCASDSTSLDQVTNAWVARANEVSNLSLRSLILTSVLAINLCEETLSWRSSDATFAILSTLCGMLSDVYKRINSSTQKFPEEGEEVENILFLSDMLGDDVDSDQQHERADDERDRVGSLSDRAQALDWKGVVVRVINVVRDKFGAEVVENVLKGNGEETMRFVASAFEGR